MWHPLHPRDGSGRLVGIAGIALVLFSIATAHRIEAETGHLVISEIQTSRDGVAPEVIEFIELYNPTPAPVSLVGWSLQYRNGPNPSFGPQFKITSGAVQPYGFYLFCRNCQALGVPGVAYDPTFALADGSGTVFLVRDFTTLTGCSSSSIVDRVAYGTGAYLCPETAPAPAPPRNSSIERLPATLSPLCGNGTDTGDNSADFVVRTPAGPQNGASPVEACVDLDVAVSDDPDPTIANQTVSYAVLVHNAGPSTGLDTRVGTALSSNLVFLSTAGCVNDPAGFPTCDLGDLPADGSRTVSLQARVGPCSGAGETASISVACSTQSREANPSDNSAGESTTIVGAGVGPCDDGNACTTEDTCSGGACVGGQPHPNGMCDDGNPCTTNDLCDAAGATCISGPPLNCDDGFACTADSCDPATGCRHVGGFCDDGNPCTYSDRCDGYGSCTGTPLSCQGNPCADGVCDTATGQCELRPAPGRSCFDGNLCAGPDSCDANGQCASGPPVSCDDGNFCTGDFCHSGHCVNDPLQNGTPCDDGNACTSNDQCSGGSCAGFFYPPVCNDGNPCTTDGCSPGAGCVFTASPAGSSCDDGLTCTVNDNCNADGQCVAGLPPAGQDADGDRWPDSCDCLEQDPTAFAYPQEVTGLRLLADKQTLTWNSAAPSAGSGTVHDVIRGFVPELPVGSSNSTRTCVASGIPESSFAHGEAPGASAAFWYLVRARNACGQGPCGASTDGAPVDCGACP